MPVRRLAAVPELAFYGEIGDSLWKYAIAYQDAGAAINARLEPNAVAPVGSGGECLFRNLYLTVTARTACTITVKPKIDGKLYETVTINHAGTEPATVVYEIAISSEYDDGSGPTSRAGVRGTWATCEITGVDTGDSGFDVTFEGVEIEWEQVREQLGHRTFTKLELAQATGRTDLELAFWGEQGDSLFKYAGVGASTCIEVSADGLICKEVNGLRAGLDFGVGKDTFDLTKWKRVLGTGTFVHDVVNGYVEADGATYIYDDPANPELANVMVSAEVWYNDCNDRLPGVAIDLKAGDGANFLRHMTTCQGGQPRQVAGVRVGGADINGGIVVGIAAQTWHWKSVHAQDLTGPDDVEVWGSDNDSNWPTRMLAAGFLTAGQLATLKDRTGKGGLSVWVVGFGSPVARYRRYREYGSTEAGATIICKNVPDNHKVVIPRDAGLHGADTSLSLSNTSGGLQTLVFDHGNFPVPASTKLLGPMTRVELRTIAGSVLVATMTPIARSATDVDGVNWGDVYNMTVPGGISWLLEPNAIAPAGSGGECLFRNVYLSVERNNTGPIVITFTPILDDTELTPITVNLAGTGSSKPLREVVEIALFSDFGTPTDLTHGLRGSWFTFRAAGSMVAGPDVTFLSAEVEFEIVRESRSNA